MTEPVALHLNPGETEAKGMERRIKMHEFLMSGGVPLKERDKDGNIQYGPPIEIAKTPFCPFHGDICDAWDEIVAGRGLWTKMELELDGLKQLPESARRDRLIADLEAKLADRPRDYKALRERTPEQYEAEKAAIRAADPRVHAAAGPKGPGNPWDRKPGSVPYGNGTKAPRNREKERIWQETNMTGVRWVDGVAYHADGTQVDFGSDDGSPRPTYDRNPKRATPKVSETAAVSALNETATEIEIEGDEDE